MALAKTQPDTGILLVVTCGLFFVVNTLVILVSHLLFPQHLVLGTQCVSFLWALIHSGISLALIDTAALPFLRLRARVLGQPLTPREWLIAYFFINFVGIWLVARLANQFGFGISSWMVALIMALVLNFIQNYVLTKVIKLW